MHKFTIIGKQQAVDHKTSNKGKSFYSYVLVAPDQSKFKATIFESSYSQKMVDTLASGEVCVIEGRLDEGFSKDKTGIGYLGLSITSVVPLYSKGKSKGGQENRKPSSNHQDGLFDESQSNESFPDFNDDDIPF